MRDLGERIGTTGCVIAGTFLVYLLGILLVAASNTVFQVNTRPIDSSRSSIRHWLSKLGHVTKTGGGTERARSAIASIDQLVADLVVRAGGVSDDELVEAGIVSVPLDTSDWADRNLRMEKYLLTRQIVAEAKSSDINVRLLVERERIYDETQRMRAEAELRFAIVFPGVLLAFAVAIDSPWATWSRVLFVVLASAVLILIGRLGLRERQRAQEVALQAVADRVITTPAIDLVTDRFVQDVDSGDVPRTSSSAGR